MAHVVHVTACVRNRCLLAMATARCLGCTGEDGRSQIDRPEVVFDGDGFTDGLVSVRVQPRITPGGVVGAPDGSLFVHGHAPGDGDDAGTGGDNLIIKLRADGKPDVTFGEGGVFVLPDVREAFVDVAVLPDGSLVPLGSTNGRPAAWKLAADGSLEASFGDGGVVEIDAGGTADASARPVALAPRDDGSLDIVGTTETADSAHPFAARVSATGAVEVARAFASVSDTWWGVLIDGSGSTIVLGERATTDGVQPLIGRLTDLLELDTAFGPGSYARVAGVASYCREPVAIPGGGFAAAGSRGQGADFGAAVLRWTPAGNLDPSFDDDGHLAIAEDRVVAVVPLASGDLLAQLQATTATAEPPEYVVRITTGGAIDPSYGDGGRSTGTGFGLGLTATSAGDTYAAGTEWPDTIHIRPTP